MPSDVEVQAGMTAITVLTREWRAKYGGTLPSLEAEALAVLEAAEAVRAVSPPEEPAEHIARFVAEQLRYLRSIDRTSFGDGRLDAYEEIERRLVPVSQEPPKEETDGE